MCLLHIQEIYVFSTCADADLDPSLLVSQLKWQYTQVQNDLIETVEKGILCFV